MQQRNMLRNGWFRQVYNTVLVRFDLIVYPPDAGGNRVGMGKLKA